MKPSLVGRIVLAVCVVGISSGCESLTEAQVFWTRLQGEWKEFQKLVGVKPSSQTDPTSGSSPLPSELIGTAEKNSAARSKANAEFLQELYRVVLLKEPESRSEFGNLVDTLNQGASIEGIYNGLIHSASYRELEAQNQGATPASLRVFSEEMAYLQSYLPETDRTLFDERSTRPLPGVTEPEYREEKGARSQPAVEASATPVSQALSLMERKDPSPEELKARQEKLEKLFVGASVFTLKRLLGDEMLKVLALYRAYPELLAQWYGKFALRSLDRNLDFGLELRNKRDVEFHRTWAMRAPYDLIQWEALNRLHRMVNTTNRSP